MLAEGPQPVLRIRGVREVNDQGLSTETQHLMRDRGADITQPSGDGDGLAIQSHVSHMSSLVEVRIVVPVASREVTPQPHPVARRVGDRDLAIGQRRKAHRDIFVPPVEIGPHDLLAEHNGVVQSQVHAGGQGDRSGAVV